MAGQIKITVQRSGGFAGVRLPPTVVDSATLPPDQAEALNRAVDQVNFFALPAQAPSPPRGADRFQYRVTVSRDRVEHTVQVHEGNEGPLKELIEQARALAPPKRRPEQDTNRS